jgi:phosphatidylglycerol lysyltransferase
MQRVRGLLRVGTAGSIAHMATWPGNRYWFSADGRHAVAYRATSSIAVTVGEPIGPADGSHAAARDFVRYCEHLGMQPVFYTVRPEFVHALSADGRWASIVVGDDTLIDPRSFSMSGKRWKDVRTSMHRAERNGVRAVWTDWSRLSSSMRAQIAAIAGDWAARRQIPELQFTVGGIEQLKDGDVKLMLAIDAHGRIEAATSWMPNYRDGVVRGLTLDFMRRRPDSMNGATEFLIASTLLAAQRWDLEEVSLSIAPLASTAVGVARADRAVTAIARILEPAYGFASLATFKEKFQPTLRPVMMAYPDAFSLPAISLALGRMYLPDLSMREAVRLLGTCARSRAQTRGKLTARHIGQISMDHRGDAAMGQPQNGQFVSAGMGRLSLGWPERQVHAAASKAEPG